MTSFSCNTHPLYNDIHPSLNELKSKAYEVGLLIEGILVEPPHANMKICIYMNNLRAI